MNNANLTAPQATVIAALFGLLSMVAGKLLDNYLKKEERKS